MQITRSERKRQQLFLVLSGIFISNALLAELIGVKIFSGEGVFGLPGAQLDLFSDFKLDFNLTAGVVIWPVVFVTTDIINEYFGKAGVKRVTYLTVLLILYAFLVITVVTALPPAQFWLDVNNRDASGNTFDINFAFNSIYRQGLGIIVGSVVAFLVSQFLDAYVFHWLRQFTGSRKIWLRATGSTLISQLIDSVVVLFLAFYVFGNWSINQVLSVAIINYLYKFFVAIALTPLLYVAHYLIDQYLGKPAAEDLVEQAAVE
ncbi:MAG: queuosine precursor transporter [Hymenobacteraceae bacterium]|nr:queuosine precursor transporter [Hymenobacteraceae bacterium]MDX5396287.1 queuosine precursor transporter [Hymenobacteraceae bacterium]MDX5442244.1 queuosine precursor transporter [Hymenobacteraceae bacterium]MDX5512348.1 queuosine precursor transporter [Hymenobacteraceae bacterium]